MDVEAGSQVADSNSRYFRFRDVPKRNDPADVVLFMEVKVRMVAELGDEEECGLCFDLVAHIPQAQVASLELSLPILLSEKPWVEMCDQERLSVYYNADLSMWPNTEPELLRDLDPLEIIRPNLSGGWGAFTDFLSRRAAVGNRISSLKFHCGDLRIDEDVIEKIEREVSVFEIVQSTCSCGHCA